MKNNLFWLLFGSTAMGLTLCGLMLYFLILFAMAQDQVLDFADDVQMIRIETEEYCHDANTLQTLQDCITSYSQPYGFILQLVQVESSGEPKVEGEEIGVVGDRQIYEYQDDAGEEGFQAAIPLRIAGMTQTTSDPYWLIVKDNLALLSDDEYEDINPDDPEQYEDQDELDIALMGAIYGIVILLFILAIFLYFPVRKLNRWLGEVQYASEQIAQQNYQVRLTEYKTQPLGSLASSFNGMAEKIADHIRDKNVLANAIAHELRTPLTRFRLALGLLNRQPLDKLAKELVNDLERYTDDLEMITDNTLRLATLRDSKINLQDVKLDVFITHQGEKFSASYPHLAVQVSSQRSDVKTDIGFLQLALDNLLSNACQYAESKVQLSQWQEGDQIIIEVCDDGPGIAEKDVEYIQQAFTRLDESRTRATGGTGLGLAIVRLAVQRLKGQLVFLPTANSGTKIRLILTQVS